MSKRWASGRELSGAASPIVIDSTLRRAIRTAIASMRIERHTIAVQANLEDLYHAGLPGTITASKRRKKLDEAIAILEKLGGPK